MFHLIAKGLDTLKLGFEVKKFYIQTFKVSLWYPY